jgi:hypothetical protein
MRAYKRHSLREKLGDSFFVERRRNEIESSIIKSCLEHLRVIRRPNENCTNGYCRSFGQINHVNPCAVRKLSVCKDQVRVGLFEQAHDFRTPADAECIHAQTPEYWFERLARFSALVDHQSKRFAPQGTPLPSPSRPELPRQSFSFENRRGRQEPASAENTVFQPHPVQCPYTPASRQFRLLTILNETGAKSIG